MSDLIDSVRVYYPMAKIEEGKMLFGFPTPSARGYARGFNRTSEKYGYEQRVKFNGRGLALDTNHDGKWDFFVTNSKPYWLWFEPWKPQFLFRPDSNPVCLRRSRVDTCVRVKK